ncbi:transglycosylase domain-containing protein [Bacillus testis]|uniref:transglycosylase domain-containing protein n=1 Tax=Bacillus testis TaxID=1622072 RepID=UPI0008410919|nr:transglycosylase domain-containing protein [Bacillus testis]
MNENRKPNKMKELLRKLQHEDNKRRYRIAYQVIWNLLLVFIILGVLGAAFAGGAGAGYFASLVQKEPIRSKAELAKDIYNYEETSEFYFAGNTYLGKLRTDLEREEVPLSQMPKYLKDAVIATEDENFYKHEGVVPKAIIRAVIQEMTNSSVQSGGSTLTQQLIKQQILTNEVSFDRKAKEILLALRLEKFFTKDDILEAYLNISPFGRNSSGTNIAGVQAAAKGIFGKDVKNLNLAQSAYIAGLPQSPFGYTPFTNQGTRKENLEPGLNRQKIVLNRMYSGGFISEKEYNEAMAYDVTKDFIPARPPAYEKYPSLTAEIERRSIEIISAYLANKDGISETELNKNKDIQNKYRLLADQAIRQNGYRIHTTINKDMFDKMDQVTKNFPYYGNSKHTEIKDPQTGKVISAFQEPVETGAMLIENKTGKILSFVGGRDYKREAMNHATQALRPNGSTMKPLVVYAPAIEMGKLAPGSLVLDAPLYYSGYTPSNYTGTFKGLMTAREALKTSQNIPAVKFYLDILNKRPAEYLAKMGVTSLTEGDYYHPSLALGGLDKGISVEENVNAYATFANEGKFVDAYMIEKIETKKGEVIYQHKSNTVDVFSPQTAYLTIDMMRDVISSGTATSLRNRLNFSSDFAGKTGTGQDYKDAWFVATNPNVTFGVWTGYDHPKPLEQTYKGLSYSKRNIYLWADLMNAAYSVDPALIGTKKRFRMPEGLVNKSYCSALGLSQDVCTKAGIGTDLYPANFAMNIQKANMSTGKFVTVGDQRYLALDSTPSDFVESGAILSGDFLKMIAGPYISTSNLPAQFSGFGGGGSAAAMSENGRAPYAFPIRSSGNTITWGAHGDNDIIGYRVYNNNRKVATIKAGQTLSYSGGPGSYTVKAVDIAGNESPASNAVVIGGGERAAAPSAIENGQTGEPSRSPSNQVTPPADKPEEQQADTGTQPSQGNGRPNDHAAGNTTPPSGPADSPEANANAPRQPNN